jgi:hypothetical protein
MVMADDVAAPEKDKNELESQHVTRSKASSSAAAPPGQSIRRLTVGRADDPNERLADRMADSAVSQLRRSEHGPTTVRRSAANTKDPLGGTQVDADVHRTIDSRRGAGSPLRKREAEHFSNSYGTDLSGVRLHTDSTADKLSRSLQANAFTTGNDIFFRKGTYQPGTSSGDHLIGHELAHVATEGGGAQRSIRRWGNPFGGKKEVPPQKHTPKDNTTVFQKLGELLGDNVEEQGDEVEFNLEITIPVSGYTVGATLGVSAEKDDKGVTAKVAMAVTGGVSIPGIDLKAALGGYLEAKGKDGKMAGDLLGYSMYRRLAESNMPAEVQAYMFGGGDKNKAAENMNAIELAAFGEGGSNEFYAESGASLEGEAAIGGDDGVKIKGGATTGTRTDRESMKMAGAEAGGKKAKGGYMAGLAAKAGLDRGAEKSIGRKSQGYSFSAEIPSPFGGSVELSYESKWLEEDGGVVALDSREFGVEITVPPEVVEAVSGALEKIKPLTDTIFHIISTREAMAKAKTKKEKTAIWVEQNVDKAKEVAVDQLKGAFMELGPVKQVTDAANAVGDKIKDAAKGAAKAAGDALGIGYSDEESTSVKLTVDLKEFGVEVGIAQSEEKKLSLGVLEASMKKTSTKSIGVGSKG